MLAENRGSGKCGGLGFRQLRYQWDEAASPEIVFPKWTQRRFALLVALLVQILDGVPC